MKNIQYIYTDIAWFGQCVPTASKMFNYYLSKAMPQSKKYKLRMKRGSNFNSFNEMYRFLFDGHLTWVDDYDAATRLDTNGCVRPDMIGPTINLDHHLNEWVKYADRIRHTTTQESNPTYLPQGIDTQLWSTHNQGHRPNIVWIGDPDNPNDNYALWKYITKDNIPGYKYIELQHYSLHDLYDVLQHATILVDTSVTMPLMNFHNEARSMGVIVMTRNTQHPCFENVPFQIDYDPVCYIEKIQLLLNNPEYLGMKQDHSVRWVNQNCNLESIRHAIESSCKKVLSWQQGNLS